jgi:hypothetical protein
LKPTCAAEFCHLNPVYFGLGTPELAYRTLVGVPSWGPKCVSLGLSYVEPGDPERSLVYLKVQEPPPCGLFMPPPGFRALDPRQLEQLREWIARGALQQEAPIPLDASSDGAPDAGAADASIDAPRG